MHDFRLCYNQLLEKESEQISSSQNNHTAAVWNVKYKGAYSFDALCYSIGNRIYDIWLIATFS